MKRQPETRAALHRVRRGDYDGRLVRSRKSVMTNVARIFTGSDWENGEQPVAYELKDFPTVLHDRRHLAVKISIEHVNKGLRRQAIGKACKSAHIRQPDRRVDRGSVATPDSSGSSTRPGIVADVGIKQNASRTLQQAILGNAGQWSDNGFDGGNLGVREAVRLLSCEGCAMNAAACEKQRHREIIRRALR